MTIKLFHGPNRETWYGNSLEQQEITVIICVWIVLFLSCYYTPSIIGMQMDSTKSENPESGIWKPKLSTILENYNNSSTGYRNSICFASVYLLDSDLSGCYPPFEQSRPGFLCILIIIKSSNWKSP